MTPFLYIILTLAGISAVCWLVWLGCLLSEYRSSRLTARYLRDLAQREASRLNARKDTTR